MRIALQAFLAEPDLAILDEPTNHLDYQAKEWLANTFRMGLCRFNYSL